MYLLIHNTFQEPIEVEVFTFHNVSINSFMKYIEGLGLVVFTFHNVSINS